MLCQSSKEGWGTNLGEHTIRGTCSLPESRLHWSAVEGSGPSCLPTSSHLGQSAGEVSGLSVQQNYSDCSRVAHHALVLGPSDHVRSNSTVPAQSANPAIQSLPSQDSTKPKSQCLAPGASVINELGLSEVVAARIEAPQRVSTKSVYEAK